MSPILYSTIILVIKQLKSLHHILICWNAIVPISRRKLKILDIKVT